MTFRGFMWLDGCTKSMYICSLLIYQTQTLSKTLFLLPVSPWSRAAATVEAAEKSSSHLPLELLFSHPARVPHANKTECRLNSPPHPKLPKLKDLLGARFPQDWYLVLSLSEYCSSMQKILFPARRKCKSDLKGL